MWQKSKYDELPDQRSLCTREGTVCTKIQVCHGGFGWWYRKETRLALITSNGMLYIYKYSLLAVGAGMPYIGHVFELCKAKRLQVSAKKDGIAVSLADHKGNPMTFTVEAENAKVWAAKLFLFTVKAEKCTVNHPSHNAFCCERSKMRHNEPLSFATQGNMDFRQTPIRKNDEKELKEDENEEIVAVDRSQFPVA